MIRREKKIPVKSGALAGSPPGRPPDVHTPPRSTTAPPPSLVLLHGPAARQAANSARHGAMCLWG